MDPHNVIFYAVHAVLIYLYVILFDVNHTIRQNKCQMKSYKLSPDMSHRRGCDKHEMTEYFIYIYVGYFSNDHI